MRSLTFFVVVFLAGCPANRSVTDRKKIEPSLVGVGMKLYGEDGQSIRSAVVVSGASDSWEIIAAEKAWIDKYHSGWNKTGQDPRH